MRSPSRSTRAHTRRIAPGLYTARSHTRAARRHYVAVSGTGLQRSSLGPQAAAPLAGSGAMTCSCEAYTYGKDCWAMKAVARRLLRRRDELKEVAAR